MERFAHETHESMPSFLRDLAEIKMPQVVLGVAIEFMLITLTIDFSLPQHIARPTSTSNASRSNGFFRML